MELLIYLFWGQRKTFDRVYNSTGFPVGYMEGGFLVRLVILLWALLLLWRYHLNFKTLNHKIKFLKLILSLISKVNSQTSQKKPPFYKKHKKPILILKDTPRTHIPKRNTKISISIPWSRILINFELAHMTPCLARCYFDAFVNFWDF